MSNEKPPIVYQASPLTGEYVGQSFADPNPLDPDNWLIPGMAFTEKPPEVAVGFAAVHVQGSAEVWSVLQDLRGTVYQTEDGKPLEWSQFGALPDTLTTLARPSNLYTWVGGAWVLDEVAELAQFTAIARAERDRLLVYATLRINPLQDDVDNDESTPEGVALLKLWKQYRSAVSKTETKPGWPQKPQWPVPPVPLEVNNSETETVAVE